MSRISNVLAPKLSRGCEYAKGQLANQKAAYLKLLKTIKLLISPLNKHRIGETSFKAMRVDFEDRSSL